MALAAWQRSRDGFEAAEARLVSIMDRRMRHLRTQADVSGLVRLNRVETRPWLTTMRVGRKADNEKGSCQTTGALRIWWAIPDSNR